MIKSLYLEGFKSFGKPVKIDFRDITLLYGENSSGKSSILQALQYAREVFCHGNLDCLKTEIGGEFVDLRGFDNFVHGRDSEAEVRIGIEVSILGADNLLLQYLTGIEPLFEMLLDNSNVPMHPAMRNTLAASKIHERNVSPIGFPLPVMSSAQSIELRLTIRNINEHPDIAAVELLVEREQLIKLELEDAAGEEGMYRFCVSVNINHTALPESIPDIKPVYDLRSDPIRMLGGLGFDDDAIRRRSEVDQAEANQEEADLWLRLLDEECATGSTKGWEARLEALAEGGFLHWRFNSGNWLPNLLGIEALFPDDFFQEFLIDPDRQLYSRYNNPPWSEAFSVSLDDGILGDMMVPAFYGSAFLLHAFSQVKHRLKNMKYIGPLRSHYTAPIQKRNRSDTRCWSDGLGAWDELSTANRELLNTVNKWLVDERLFNFDCRVGTTMFLGEEVEADLESLGDDAVQRFKQLLVSVGSSEQVMLRTESGIPLRSTDLGVGFSQILPIVVAARGPTIGCILLEQPELHIHPRLQAVLGDLLATGIEARLDGPGKRQFIIETHSEFLLLRLMRRIRETTKELPSDGPRLLCDNVAIYHIKKVDGCSEVKKIELNTLGNLTDYWPDDLFDLSFKEQFGE